jgi:hypothetical protein
MMRRRPEPPRDLSLMRGNLILNLSLSLRSGGDDTRSLASDRYDSAMTEEEGVPPEDVIVSALKLARERVTGDDADAKQRRREELADMIIRVQMHGSIDRVPRPTAEELTALLGDPDDGELRRALAAWG